MLGAALFFFPTHSPAEPPKDQAYINQIVESTMRQLENISRVCVSLDEFGKNSLEQSAVVLDMGAGAQMVLGKWLSNKKKDWKVRYWAADMLAYIAPANATKTLMRRIRDNRENRLIRLRALDSTLALWQKYRTDTLKLQSDLESALSKTSDPKVRSKIQATILEIDI